MLEERNEVLAPSAGPVIADPLADAARSVNATLVTANPGEIGRVPDLRTVKLAVRRASRASGLESDGVSTVEILVILARSDRRLVGLGPDSPRFARATHQTPRSAWGKTLPLR